MKIEFETTEELARKLTEVLFKLAAVPVTIEGSVSIPVVSKFGGDLDITPVEDGGQRDWKVKLPNGNEAVYSFQLLRQSSHDARDFVLADISKRLTL